MIESGKFVVRQNRWYTRNAAISLPDSTYYQSNLNKRGLNVHLATKTGGEDALSKLAIGTDAKAGRRQADSAGKMPRLPASSLPVYRVCTKIIRAYGWFQDNGLPGEVGLSPIYELDDSIGWDYDVNHLMVSILFPGCYEYKSYTGSIVLSEDIGYEVEGVNKYIPICETSSSKLARSTNVDMMAKVQINLYAAGLHRQGSGAVTHYTMLELADRFKLMNLAFDQEDYRVDKNLEVI